MIVLDRHCRSETLSIRINIVLKTEVIYSDVNSLLNKERINRLTREVQCESALLMDQKNFTARRELAIKH